ncbi:MAG: GNAT family N-acetyltransferase, partial [Phycisphaeraceae bacterium]|nr:GNAT family N-acetyltransferase [Phycisphaeraceae bacterium]
MSEQVIRLAVGDYEQLMVFLARAFGYRSTDWFAANLAVLYEPTEASMRCNFAVKKDGRIVGNVGLFPFEMSIGGHTFRVAGIGGVSTDPDERKSGLMKLIMDPVMAEIQQEKFPISWLGGQRQRYRYWGYERAGCCVRAVLNSANVRHEPLWQQSVPLKLEPITGPGEFVQAAMELHAAQAYRCLRRPEHFFNHLRQWSGRPVAARAEGGTGRVVAYAVQNSGSPGIDELVAADVPSGLGLLRSLIERDGSLTVTLNSALDPLAQAVLTMAESARVEETGNW